jgi:hypothetical protein
MGGGTCGKESRVNRIRKWLVSWWHGTPIPIDRSPALDSPDDLETLARLIESGDASKFEEIARRLQD